MLSQFQLKNGLKVFLYQSKRSPVVSVQAWVRTGSADERKKEQGLSHFIEHLVFKGTPSYGPGEIAQVVEGSGGELNAYTSFDQTVFYVTISKESTSVALQTISEMMGAPLFDKTEVDREREVVIEEIKRGQDSLGRRASQLMFSTAFKKHPYGVPVIGYEENIKKWKISEIKKYFQERYSAKNMFLVVTGDFEKNSIKKEIEEKFKILKTNKIRKVKRSKDIPNKKLELSFEESAFQQAISYLSFHTPKATEKDIPALEVLALVLGQGEGSRLVKKLKLEKNLANFVGSSLFTAKDPGLFLVSLGYEEEKFEICISEILAEIKKLKTSLITQSELDRAIINLVSEPLFAKETVEGLSGQIGSGVFQDNDPKAQEKYLKRLIKVSTGDVRRVAQKYLDFSKMVFSDFSKNEKSKTVKWLVFESERKSEKTEKQKSTQTSVKGLKVDLKSDSPELEMWQHSSGLSAMFYPSTDTSVVSIKGALLGGARLVNPQLAGLTELLSRCWLAGTVSKNEEEINSIIEGSASSMNAVSGRNTLGINAEFLKPFSDGLSDFYWEALTKPTFPKEVLIREKEQMLIQLKQRDDNPSQQAFLLFQESIFPNHPYAIDTLGNETSLAKINEEMLKSHHSKVLNSGNLRLMISGNFNKKEWKKRIDLWAQDLKPGSNLLQKITLPSLVSSVKKYKQSKKEQSHLIVGFRGPDLQDSRREALEVLQAILAGQGGRLFLELRDKNSLAYSVSPVKFEGFDAGYFGAYIGCAPDKVPKAYSMMWEEFNKLKNNIVPEDELLRAKISIIGGHDISIQKVSTQAQAIFYEEIYTGKGKSALSIKDAIMKVSARDVQNLAVQLFNQPEVSVLVGPENNL